MRIRRWMSVLLSLSLVGVLTGCGGAKPQDGGTQESTAQQPAAAQQAELKKISVRLDWSTNAIHAPIYAALEKGFYKEAGLDVTINPSSDKDDVLKLVDTGRDTIGLYYQSSVIKAPSKGYNVKAVGTYVQHPLNVILVDQRAGVKSLKDLEGKVVGFTEDPAPKGKLSTTASSLKMMMEKEGADFSKVQLLNVGENGVQALATQQVAALGGVYEYHEKYLLDREGIKTDVYRLHEHGAPDFYELVLVASEQAATEQAETIKAFIQATSKGVQYSKEQTGEVVDILLKAAPTLKRDLVEASIKVVLPLFQDEGQPFGIQTRERWESAAQWMVANEQIEAAPDLDKLLAE